MLRSRLLPKQTKWPAPRPAAALADFVLLLSPYAPHVAEELWARLGHDGSITYVPWPAVDESLLVQSTVQLPVQVGQKFPCCCRLHAHKLLTEGLSAQLGCGGLYAHTL